jgi:hypothetical protein
MGVLNRLIWKLSSNRKLSLIKNRLSELVFEKKTEINSTISSPDPLIPIKESEPIKEVEETVDKRIHVLYKKSTIGRQILVHRSENSVLDHPEGLEPYEVAGRKRLATTSGVYWFADRHLATVSVYGEYLRIYKLEEYPESGENKVRLNMIHEFTDGITFPDAVAVCQDRSLIAVTHSMTQEKGVSLHRMDKQTFEPGPAFIYLRIENTGHGVHFSPDAHYLAFTTVDGPGTVEVYDLNDSPVRRVCLLSNMHPYLRPKDVCFTADAKYVAIIYSEPLSPKFIKRKIVGKRLAIHRFDADTGMIEEESIAILDNATSLVSCFELASFRPDIDPEMYHLFVTNQACDKVIEIGFNPRLGSLQINGSHSADFSFPHGLDISADGKLLAVSNFGDDCIRIFELEQEPNETVNDTRLHILLCGQVSSAQLLPADRQLIDLTHAFSNQGYKVSILLPAENIGYTDELAMYADAVFQLNLDPSEPKLPFDKQYVSQFVALIKAESIDIIQSDLMFIPEIMEASRRTGVRAIHHVKEL